MAQYKYSESYSETVQLGDGTSALLRPIQATDKAALQAGFRRMSARSRYQRCMGQKAELTEHELKYFTELDGYDHFALAAIRSPVASSVEGIGAGRFVRLREPDVAEPAVTIVDHYQRKGLGMIILERLLGAAWERDVRRLHFELLAGNLGMKHLIEAVSHEDVHFTNDGAGCLIALIRIPHPERVAAEPDLLRQHPLFKVFAHIARTDVDVTVRHRATMPPRAA